mmetsp:Transcript_35394/g.69419  ORF Transcript_35394/g.69419 Transcript_35394/m.69419 type:complete len:178 (+) Transcript_35394:32-565(+)|eukprot:CAMPEP_0175145820 /NCGR_PEP_ID=MMETSP0087-20121206/15007_1 /TAXON_ID=136419 /ORGANISM="Unknown Unknown, Strain D1" /LENGTH=177 /DNA_ID=CAMNT_0016430657 /DNA_START=33 /DNA_END=566 /DNA_ORIENTATION=+
MSLLDNGDPVDEVGPGGIFVPAPQAMEVHEYLRSRINPEQKEQSWGSKMIYEVGTSYIIGAFAGGFFGAAAGVQKAKGMNARLKFNSMLNESGRFSSKTGNAFGIFALLYSGTRSYAANKRKTSDVYNDIIGVTAAGTLSSLPRGLSKAIGIGAGVGAAASILLYGKLKAEEYMYED